MPFMMGEITSAHSDTRRAISEWNGPDRSVQGFEIFNCPDPLGKHFHRNKEEVFIITEGGGTLLLCNVDKDGNRGGDVSEVILTEGSVVVIKPFTAHTFYLEPGTKMLCYSTAPFDPSDMPPTPWLVRQ